MDEKKFDLEIGDNVEKIGFFYIFSKFWLPVIFFIIIAIAGIIFGIYLFNSSGITNIFNSWNVF